MTVDKKTLWDYTAVVLVFFLSGTVFGFVLHSLIFVPIFFVFSLIYAKKRKTQFSRKALKIFVVYVLWATFSYAFVGTPYSFTFSIYIVYILLAMGSLCIMQSMDFYRYRRLYLNVAVFVAVTSMLLFVMQQFDMLPLTFIPKPGYGRFMMFALNNFGWWFPFNRLAGPYWEPGVFQIVLNYALIMYFKEISSLNFSDVSKAKLFVVLLALVMTKSTAGYINLVILIIAVLLNAKVSKKNVLKFACLGFASIFAIFALLTSDAYQKKMDQKGHDNTSYEIRKADNLAMLQMTIERPFVGYGLASMEARTRGRALGDRTSSNGLLFMSSQVGLPFLLAYILATFFCLKSFYPRKTILVLIFVLMLHTTEVYFYFPISLVFFFCKKGQPDSLTYSMNVGKNNSKVGDRIPLKKVNVEEA